MLLRTMRRHATIFMLHRFRNPAAGSPGIDPEIVRRGLARLRLDGFRFIGLTELFERLQAGTDLDGAVAFTIDDGYLDHATVAAPLFAEFDCPVTTFLCTGFLDRKLWFWWDQIEFIFDQTGRNSLTVPLTDGPWSRSWASPEARRAAQRDFTERCKRVPDAAKHVAVSRLAGEAGVAIPAEPPAQYAPMSWEQARAAENHGMSFGPHTVTHPVLSRTPDQQSARELTDSWRRLREELRSPVPVFCYPNGGSGDFGAREIAVLRGLGLAGAVVGMPGYAGVPCFGATSQAPFLVRRFAYPEAIPAMLQYASGLERLKERLRGTES